MTTNNANLANALIGAAVGASDTTITLQSGYVASMPTVPYKITASPFGQLPTTGNSEIMNVTAVSSNTLTVTRAIDGTSAHTFAVGDIVANGIYVEDVQPTLVSGTNIMTVGGEDILGSGNVNIPLSGISGGSTAGVLQTTSGGVVSSGLVGASNIDFTTMKLGYAQVTSNFSTSSTSWVAVSGLSVSVTIPSGVTSLKITAYSSGVANSTTGVFGSLGIWRGTVGSGTLLNESNSGNLGGQVPHSAVPAIDNSPGTGTVTYNIGMVVLTGSAIWVGNASSPAYILVEAL